MIALRALGCVLIVAGVALAGASVVVDTSGTGALHGWAGAVGMDPGLFDRVAGAVGILAVAGGVWLMGSGARGRS